MKNLEMLKQVQAFVFDVDGVMTDSTMLVTEGGQLLRRMNVRDGYALKRLVKIGYPVGCITGGSSQGVVHRLKGLGLQHIYIGIEDKVPVLTKLLEELGVSPQHTLYMGDDMPDYEVMKMVGCPTCPADADTEILKIAKYVTKAAGGKGCVREAIETVLRIQQRWI